jgi:hypothetical protein
LFPLEGKKKDVHNVFLPNKQAREMKPLKANLKLEDERTNRALGEWI